MNAVPSIFVVPNGIKKPKGIAKNEMFSMLMEITPAMANKWLEKNKNNRPLAKSKYEEYEQQILSDKWQVNGESIKFDWNGNLIDGQHRLKAIVKADKSITSYVIFGCDPEVFKTIDTGKNRSDSDVLSIAGYENTAVLASIIRVAMEYDAGKFEKGFDRRFLITHDMVLNYVLDHKNGLEKAVAYVNSNYHKCDKLITKKVMGGCYYIFSTFSETDAIDFMNKLSYGLGITEQNDPLNALRRRLIQNKSDVRKIPTYSLIIMIFKAWNYYRKKETINHLRITSTEKVKLI